MSSTFKEPKSRVLRVPIEVLICLLFFCVAFAENITSSLLIYRSCYVILGYNKSECELLGSENPDNITSELEKLSQPYANDIATVRRFVTGILNGIVCLFVGTWSDKHGRKPLMLITLGAYVLQSAAQVVFSLFSELSPWFFIISDIPILLTGGYFSFAVLAYGYMTDLTTPENRGFKYALASVAIQTGTFLGGFSCSYVFQATGYFAIYLICTLIMVGTVLLSAFFIVESLEIDEDEKFSKTILEIFSTDNLKDMLRTAFKARPNYGRVIILTVTIAGAIATTVQIGLLSILPYYLRAKFDWTLKHVTLYTSIATIAAGVVVLLGVPILEKILKLSEPVILMFSLILTLFAHIVYGLAWNDAAIYIAAGLNAFGGIALIVLRSILAKVVPMHELGKVFSFYSTTDSILSMGGSPMYTAIYDLTLDTDPAMFNFFTVALTGILIALAIYILIIVQFKMVKDVHGPEENENENSSTTKL